MCGLRIELHMGAAMWKANLRRLGRKGEGTQEGGSCGCCGLQDCHSAHRSLGSIPHLADLLLNKGTSGGATYIFNVLTPQKVLMAIYPTWGYAVLLLRGSDGQS